MATYTTSTNTDPTKATYGESSAGVSTLQRNLNEQNKGVSGYTPIAEDGKYGPLTQAASQFKATPPPVVTPPATTPPAPVTDTGISRPIYNNEPAVVQAKTVDQIQSDKMRAAQAQLSGLDDYYNTLKNESRVIGEKNSRSTDSISVLTGLAGSSEAGVQATKTNKANQMDLERIGNEQKLAVQALLGQINASAVEEAKQSRLEARQSEQDRIAYREKAQEDATKHLTLLSKANSGATLEGLKATLSPEEYNYLIKNAGGEAMAKAILFENRPKDALLGTPQLIGGKMVQAYTAPDGKVRYESIDLPAGVNPGNIKQIEKLSDGSIVIINNDGTYSTVKGTGGIDGNAPYVAGANPTVDAWVKRIQDGQSKITEIPASQASLRNAVTNGLAAGGNTGSGKPIVTELGKQALKTAQDMMADINAGKGTGAVGAKGLSSGFGLKDKPIPGTPAADFRNKYEALKSLLSLDGVKYLKGQGAISDGERALLASATSNLSVDQTEKEFKIQLQNIIDKLTGDPEVNMEGVSGSGTTSLTPDEQAKVDQMRKDNLPDDVIEQVLGKKISFNSVGGDTNTASGARTDRHNNPTAFTTDVAKTAGLVEGKDYKVGDSFANGKFHTATLLGNPVDTTIKVLDKIGFYTDSGKQRWDHTAISKSQWDRMNYDQKKQVVKSMYQKEGGTALLSSFA